MKVVVHIDRLVLQGVEPSQRDAFLAQLNARLASEFARPGVAEAWATTGHRETLRVRESFSAPEGSLGDATATALVRHGAAP
jgi:hypothetical protein